MTAPQVQTLLAGLLHAACVGNDPERLARESERRLRRNELARFNYWKNRHNRLPPLRVNQRE